MEETAKSSTWQRTTTRRFLKAVFSRRGLLALLWTISILALLYGIFDWHGRHAWKEYRQNYVAHVASLDVMDYIPKPVPDDENFAAAPIPKSWFDKPYTNFLPGQSDWLKARDEVYAADTPHRKFEDLTAWVEGLNWARSGAKRPQQGKFRTDKLDAASRAEAAPALLDGLKGYDSALAELRAASARPESRYLVNYDMNNPPGILLPHLSKIKMTVSLLELRACAELALGRNEDAFNDINFALFLGDTVKSEPFAISYLVREACVKIALQPVWEGLAEHRWSTAQLENLQTRLSQYNFIADLEEPLHYERAEMARIIDLLRKNGPEAFSYLPNGINSKSAVMKDLARLVPMGWYDLEKLRYNQLFDIEFVETMDGAARRVFPRQVDANYDAVTTELNPGTWGTWHVFIHHELIARIVLPGLGNFVARGATGQVDVDEAIIACALERYRLANHEFPETLDALAPKFAAPLPKDVVTGEPYKYRRTADGRFVLYSLGWNGKDYGGKPGLSLFDTIKGNWTWEYPAH